MSGGPREEALPQSAFRTPPSPGTLRRGLGWLTGLLASAGLAWAQGTAFSYQGQLTDGTVAANGTYDLTFSLWNAATAGAQQGATLTQTAVGVTNGLFTATLDFGAQFPGAGRWLEIAVRTNGAAAFTTLAERQPVLPTPYAIHAATAGSAATATTATTVTGSVLASQLAGTLSTDQIPNLDASKITSGTFNGNALGLTNIPLRALVQSNYTVAAWGDNSGGQTNVPVDLSKVVAVAAGGAHGLALKSNGTVVAWGSNGLGQTNVPGGLTGVVAVAAGDSHSLALKSDGTVAAWGWNGPGQQSVPTGLNGVVAVAAGGLHSLALKSDATVVAWGANGSGQTNVPASLNGVVAVAAGQGHSLALKSDGTVVAWGLNDRGQTNVPGGLSGVKAVAAGDYHSVALKSDGTVVAWGLGIPGPISVPGGLSGVVAVAAGGFHCLALKSDGSVTAWGYNNSGTTIVPGGLGEVISLAAGTYFNVVLRRASYTTASLALLDENNVFQGTVTAPGFIGDGSALTALNASALTTGVVPVARIPSLDASKITTGTFTGNGSGLTGLNASALNAGTIADPRLSANIPRLDGSPIMASPLSLNSQKLLLNTPADRDNVLRYTASFAGNSVAGPVLSGTFGGVLAAGDGFPGEEVAVLRWLSDGKVIVPGDLTAGIFNGNGSGLNSLNASALGFGTLADARLSANVARLDGSPEFTSDVRLDDHDLFLRGGADSNHGLGWFGGSGRTFAGATVDGPVLYGFLGGALGSTSSSQKLALRWNSSQQVAIGGGTADTALTVSATGAGISAETVARFRNTTSGEHTAISVDARAGQDAVIYLGNNGTRAWDIRYDEGSGELQFRTQTDNNARMWLTRNGDLNIDGTYRPISDRNKKAGFEPVDVDSVLAKVASLPLTTWHYTNDVTATPHLGPMAQDFHAAFGLGGDDKTIATVDADGVALAAIQGLHRKVEVLSVENAELRARLERLEALLLNRESRGN